jgi:hypothetical protein
MTRRIKILLTLAATALLAMTTVPAAAITGGDPDGNQHPNVGIIVFYSDGGRFRCSATLMTPTVLLTAAHCAFGTVGKTAVSFASEIADAPPFPVPVAADPSKGYTAAELKAAGVLSGTAYAHPDYSNFTDTDNWNDTGVVVLDKPVNGIPTAKLAPTSYLDQFKAPKLRKTLFTAVGYGSEVRKLNGTSGKPTPMSYPLLRRYAEMPGQSLTDQILQLNGNINDTAGTGGTCSGIQVGRSSKVGMSSRTRPTCTPTTAGASGAFSGWTFPWCRSGWQPSGSSPSHCRNV